MYQTDHGPGMTVPSWYGDIGQDNLTSDDVRRYLDMWLKTKGSSDLRTGRVVVKNASTIEAEIVRKDDNAPIQKWIIDRHTGLYSPR